MSKVLLCALGVAILATAGSAYGQGKVWDDLSWWGLSGATPAPVKDTGSACCPQNLARAGCWWWPTEPASNANDQELWGNRGVVYNITCPVAVTPPPPPQPPRPREPVKPARVKPTFNNVLFDFDKSVLKPEGRVVADEVVASMKAHSQDTLVLEGHTDNIGTDEYNNALGQRRADAVKRYMVEQGIAPERVEAKSFGESQPAVPNDSPGNRALNRRVVFNINIKGS
ncbi:MAG TPA: OmpA family protein [Candidatus Bathyarchaeia archaeon]|nr:OmpA family protein [Candidatus Bathyarchaeia archaeon]